MRKRAIIVGHGELAREKAWKRRGELDTGRVGPAFLSGRDGRGELLPERDTAARFTGDESAKEQLAGFCDSARYGSRWRAERALWHTATYRPTHIHRHPSTHSNTDVASGGYSRHRA